MNDQTKDAVPDPERGLVAGGRGGPEDEMLIDGQEEVFSRTEVASGRPEHHAEAGSGRCADKELEDAPEAG